jgi:hypothetical protein
MFATYPRPRAVVKHRRDQRDVIVQVDAAEVRVVHEDAIARRQALRPIGGDGSRHDVGERAQVRRLRERLRDGAELTVEERAREIAARLDVGRVRGAAKRRAHLLGDGEERVPDDLEADGIDTAARRGWR